MKTDKKNWETGRNQRAGAKQYWAHFWILKKWLYGDFSYETIGSYGVAWSKWWWKHTRHLRQLLGNDSIKQSNNNDIKRLFLPKPIQTWK